MLNLLRKVLKRSAQDHSAQDQRPEAAPSGRSPAPLDPALAELAGKIQALAPQEGGNLLALLSEGLAPDLADERRFQIAEALSAAVYPKYKFSEYGRAFLEDQEFLDYYRQVMDPGNWHSLDRKYAMDQLLTQVQHLDGDFAECGVYKGGTALLLCRRARPVSKRVHLFDSFQGLSEPDRVDGQYWEAGRLKGTQDEVRAALAGFDNFELHPGWIPEQFDTADQRRYAFVHVDVDLYQPTRDALAHFYPRLEPGGIILLDDHGFNSCPGARLAADEYFADKPEKPALLPTGQALVIKQQPPAGPLVSDQEPGLDPVPRPIRWTPELVERFWNGVGRTQLSNLSFALLGGHNLIMAVGHMLSPGQRILDYGAGDGHLVRQLCQRGFSAAAYEPAPARRENLAKALEGREGFLGVVGPEGEEAYDVVFASEVIEHVLAEDLDGFLRRLNALVKPGGLVVVTSPNQEDLRQDVAYCPVCNSLFNRWQHVRSLDSGSLPKLLGGYGFQEIVTHRVDFTDNLFVQYENVSGKGKKSLPSYLADIRDNRPVGIGGQTRLLYLGRKAG